MSELPEGWEEVPLSMLCIFNPRHNSSEDRKQEISFVPMPAVSDTDGRIEDHGTKVLGDVWKGYTHFQEGDVIFAKITPCMENGKIAVARGLHGGIACGSTEFHVLRPFTGVNAKYLWYFLRRRDFRIEAERHMTGAVGQRRVPKAYLEKYLIPLPPANEQCRIVTKLDSLFERTRRAREELSHIPRLIENYKKAILEAAFRGDLTKDWRCVHGITSTSWKKRKIDEVLIRIRAGKNLRCEERPPNSHEKGVVKVSAVTWGYFDPIQSKTLPDNFSPPSDTLIQKGDFLFSRANTIELVGACVLVKEASDNLYLSDKILRLDLRDEDKPWLLWFLRSPQGRNGLEECSTGNQLSMRNISQKALGNIELPFPDEQERREIIRRIEKAMSWLNTVDVEQRQATHLLDRLDQANLAKAFRGELVPQGKNDEPASVLLERIRLERGAQVQSRSRRKSMEVVE